MANYSETPTSDLIRLFKSNLLARRTYLWELEEKIKGTSDEYLTNGINSELEEIRKIINNIGDGEFFS